MFKKIVNNQFVKVFSYNGFIVFGKLFTSFVVSKISAIYLGPSGYAIVGNFKNIFQGILGLTSTGFESGIIKYIAENKTEPKRHTVIVSSVFTLSIVISLGVGLVLFIFSDQLGTHILKDVSLSFIFKYLSFCLPLISFNFIIIYILNGLQKFKLYTIAITIANFINAIMTFFLVYFFNLKGALMASFLVPFFSFFSFLLFKDIRLLFLELMGNFKYISISFLKSISIYLVMATYSTILISLSYLLIRNNIILILDTDTAGLWEAMNKISGFYMIFFSSLFTLYLLPLLASNKSINGYISIMTSYFKYLIPFLIIFFIGILFFRVLLIQIFLTDEFNTIERFFYLQLIGDFIKIIAFSFAYQFHAKKMITSYFVSDAILYISFYIFSIYMLKQFNIQGVFYAYITSTILYFLSVFLFVIVNRNKYLERNV